MKETGSQTVPKHSLLLGYNLFPGSLFRSIRVNVYDSREDVAGNHGVGDRVFDFPVLDVTPFDGPEKSPLTGFVSLANFVEREWRPCNILRPV